MKLKWGRLSLLSRLGKQKHAGGSGLLARLIRDEEGSYLLYMTVAIPILIGFAGFASEGSLLLHNHRALQSATDAAAYSAAVAYSNGDTSTAALTTQAEAIVAEYVKSYGWQIGTGNDPVTVTVLPPITNYAGSGNTAINVTTTRPQLPSLSALWLKNPINVGGSAIAIIKGGPGGAGNCLLALGNTATGNNAADSIQLQGNPTINVPGCGVYSNSDDCNKGSVSVALGGNATINAGSVGSAGCVSLGGHSSINIPGGGAYTEQDGTLSDPYAGTPLPSSPAPPCVNQPSPVKGKITVGPGRYCGLNANGNDMTLTGGIYILDCSASTCPTAQGTTAMLIVKNAALTDSGAGSTLVFNCSTCSSSSDWASNGMLVAANGSVTLTAPASGFRNVGRFQHAPEYSL